MTSAAAEYPPRNFHAATAVRKGVRTVDDELHVRVDTWRHVDGRTATLIGMIHIADREFYQRVAAMVDDLHRSGADVHYETVRPAEPDADATPDEHELVCRLSHAINHGRLAALLGLTLQHKEHLPIQPHWINTDTDRLTLVRKTPRIRLLLSMMEAFGRTIDGLDDSARERAGAKGHAAVRRMGRPDRWLTRVIRRLTGWERGILVFRDRLAADAICAARGDVVALWGAGHLAGIGAVLAGRQWVKTAERWQVAVAAPSAPACAG